MVDFRLTYGVLRINYDHIIHIERFSFHVNQRNFIFSITFYYLVVLFICKLPEILVNRAQMNASTSSYGDAAFVTTRVASDLVGVHESSIKRWCNAGLIEHSLTSGGHRRIRIAHLVDYARSEDIHLDLHNFGARAEEVWVAAQRAMGESDYDLLVRLVHEWINDGRSDRVAHLIDFLTSTDFSIGQVFDAVVGAAMGKVGKAYLSNQISIADEHRMTQAMRDAIVLLQSFSDHGRPKSSESADATAIVGCHRGEVHEIGALLARELLRSFGWHVVYLGLNVPTEEFANQQRATGASLICVSMTPPAGDAEARAMIRVLDSLYDSSKPYRLALGGGAFRGPSGPAQFDSRLDDVVAFGEMLTFEEWLETLAD